MLHISVEYLQVVDFTTMSIPPSPMSGPSSSDIERARIDRILLQIKNIQWKNRDALEYVTKVMDIPGFGVPEVFDETEGGCSIWRKRSLYGLPTEYVKIADECVATNCLGKSCCGFVYVSIRFDAKNCKCSDLMMNFSSHVIIDVGKGTVKARGDSIEMCIGILAIFTGVGVCRMEPAAARKMQADEKAVLLAKSSPEEYIRMVQVIKDNISSLQAQSMVNPDMNPILVKKTTIVSNS